MKRYFFCLLALVIHVYVFAQSDYHPGYIIKSGGDKEEGWINFLGNASNWKHCYFKKDSLGIAIRYSPDDLIAYRFKDSKYFVSKKVATEDGEKAIFLECLISGRTTIYYSERENEYHYYIEKDGKIMEIDNKEAWTEDENGKQGYRATNRYKGILKYCFNDCPPVFRKVDASELSRKSLIKLSKEYHDYVCKDEKAFSKSTVKFGVDFSYGFGKITFFYGDMLFFKASSSYQYLVNTFAAVNLDEDKRFFFQLSIGYDVANFKQLNYDINNYFSYYRSDVTYNYSLLRSTISFKYKWNFGKVSPFLSLGMPLGVLVTNKGTLDKHFPYNNVLRSFNTGGFEGELENDKFVFGGIAELGIEFPTFLFKKGAFLSAFFERTTTISVIRNSRFGLKTGIYFK